MADASALYFGEVLHQRLKPRRHRLHYRVFSMLLDLDEIDGLARRCRLFSRNRFNLFSFCDRDHGPGDGTPLRAWVEGHLAEAGIDLDGGPIRLLCFPRMLGYVFNPLSVYFCHAPDGALRAVIYEVRNTFGQRHSYLIPIGGGAGGAVHQSCAKAFYVSLFNDVEGGYRFSVAPPTDSLAIVINQFDDQGPLLNAWLRGRREMLGDRMLFTAFLRYPLMTVKVIAGIHWEALKLWRKGLRIIRRPAPPAHAVTIVGSSAG